jgi:hypothetical protein
VTQPWRDVRFIYYLCRLGGIKVNNLSGDSPLSKEIDERLILSR